MPMPDRKPDAVLCPYPGEDRLARQYWIRDKIYPLLASFPSRRIGAKNQNLFAFVAPNEATLLFPTLHPLAGRERYDWYVVAEDHRMTMLATPVPVESYASMPGAIRFGYLRDEDGVDPPGLDERADFARFVAERNEGYAALAARLREIDAMPERGAAEDQEYQALTRQLLDLTERRFGGG